jgi:hypothetical protein
MQYSRIEKRRIFYSGHARASHPPPGGAGLVGRITSE